MRGLAEILIAAVDLLGAEGRRVGKANYKALRAGALALAFALVATAGAGFLLTSLFLALLPPLGAATAAFLTGLVATLLGGIGLFATRWMLD